MSKLLTTAALALLLTAPAYAVDVDADVSTGASVKSSSSVTETHDRSVIGVDGKTSVQSHEKHSSSHSSDAADMTVDDEE